MQADYIDSMGDDNRVVDSARVSFQKTAAGYTEEQNDKLIRYLAKHGHFTPFTHCTITLRERVPIFVARQRFKHTVGFSYNEISRRYVDGVPEFYSPNVWRSRPEGSVKQGSGQPVECQTEPDDLYERLLRTAYAVYRGLLSLQVAPEQARMTLPQSMYTEYYVTGSLAAWARAYQLRSEPSAQQEIQELAQQWDNIIQPLFPVSWDALTS